MSIEKYQPGRTGPLNRVQRVVLWSLGLMMAVGAVTLASRYPVPLPWLAAFLVAYAALLWLKPESWLLILPALLPVIDLAPWTGWILIEELDLILATTLAIGYLRTATRSPAIRPPIIASALWLLLAASYLVSCVRGLMPVTPFDANALSNYVSSYNALRIAKGFFWAWLLGPLLARTMGPQGENLRRYFFPGVMLGLIGVCMVAIWERNAFPGLLNFSSDYRTTASFSTMHTGSAALDGFLALTLPLSALLLLPGRKPAANLVGLGLFAAGTYAVLTTFSRGLYGGYLLSVLLVLLVFLRHRLTRHELYRPLAAWRLWTLPVFVLILGIGLFRVFATGGYRTLAASLIFLAGALYVGGRASPNKRRLWWLVALLPLVGLSLWVANSIPKGAYLIFILAAMYLAAFGALDVFLHDSRRQQLSPWLMLGFYWVGAAVLLVASHWGGGGAAADAAAVVAFGVVMTLVNRRYNNLFWAFDRHTATMAIVTGMGIGLLIPIIGSYYSHERFSQVGQDMATRKSHWHDVLALTNDDAMTQFLGMGLGRFPAEYLLRNIQAPLPGSFQYIAEPGNQFLRLAGPRYPAGFGEVLQFGQRVTIDPFERYEFSASYRTKTPNAVLEAFICEKLLLYTELCNNKTIELKEADGRWHEVSSQIDSGAIGAGTWYERRPVQFTFDIARERTIVDVDNFRFVDRRGNDLIKNGDLERGNDFWFYSSDRYHLPWHAQNLWLNIYFDQGWLGVLTFSILVVYALRRLSIAAWAGQLAPGLLFAGISAFLVVGLFDSLLDVPRIATLFYLILLVAVYLTNFSGANRQQRTAPLRRGSKG